MNTVGIKFNFDIVSSFWLKFLMKLSKKLKIFSLKLEWIIFWLSFESYFGFVIIWEFEIMYVNNDNISE